MFLLWDQLNDESIVMEAILLIQSQISESRMNAFSTTNFRKIFRIFFFLMEIVQTCGSKSADNKMLEDLMSLWIILLGQFLCK